MIVRRIAAILVSDVVGYSRLVERDETRVLSSMRSMRAGMIEPLLAQHSGRLVKVMGDGMLAEFSSVVDAMNCAIALQQRVAESQAGTPPELRIVFRIGINLGDVVVEGNDLLGDGVNIAARLEQMCEPGGIFLSGTAYDQLHGKVNIRCEFVGEQNVKNIQRKVRVYRVLADGAAPRRMLTPPKLWLAGVGAGVVAVVLVTAGFGWWLLQPEEGDPIAELERIGTFDAPPPSPPPEAEPSPQLAGAQPAATPPFAPALPAAQPSASLQPPTAAPSPSAQPALAPAQLPPAAPPGPVVAAAPQAPPPMDRVAALRNSIAQFDGGSCFFAMPLEISESAAKIEAFASSVPPVQTLDEAFRRDNGFEAQIGLRQVAEPQCAAVDFVRTAETSVEQAPSVQVDSVMLRNGQTLLGAVTDAASRSLAVLLVADDGTVHDISDTLRGSPGRMTFEVKLTGSNQGGAKPLLLMILATEKPLVTLGARPLPAAADLFPILSQEARLSGQRIGATLKYLKLEG